MRATAALVLLLCTPPAWSQAAPAELIAECSEDADRRSIGLEALEIECPGLEHALVELGFAPFLSERQAAELNIHALNDIVALSRQFAAQPPAEELHSGTLDTILADMEHERSERPKSWLQRVREWLQGVAGRGEDEGSWLSRWLDELEVSALVTRSIAYALVALVIVLALAVLVNELRAAGVLQGRRRRPSADGALSPTHGAAEPQFADLATAPPEERPSILLRLLVSALRRAGRLQADVGLTHRELAARAAFEQSRQRESFRQVAMLAERTLYGSGSVPSDELARVLRDGSALHTELSSLQGSRT